MVFTVGSDSQICAHNARVRAILGYSDEDLAHCSVTDLVHGSLPSSIAQLIDETRSIAEPVSANLNLRTADGVAVPVRVTVAGLSHLDQTCWVALRTEPVDEYSTKPRDGEERFRKVIDHANDAIFVFDPVGNEFLDVNQRAAEMLGYSRDELMALTPADIHPAELARFQAFFQVVTDRGQGWTDQLTCRTRSGTTLAAEIAASVVKVHGRQAVIALVRDVSDRARFEDELRMERDLLRSLMDNIPDLISFKDTESRYVRVNRAYAEFMGVENTETVIGGRASDFLEPATARAIHQDEKRLLQDGKPLVNVERLTRTGGADRWILTTKAAMRSADGQISGLVGVSRDITERKRSEQRLDVLLRASTTASASLDIDAVLPAILELITNSTPAAYSEVWLVDEGELYRAAASVAENMNFEKVQRFVAATSYQVQVAEVGQPVTIRDNTSTAGNSSIAATNANEITVYGLPLTRPGGLVGVLGLAWNDSVLADDFVEIGVFEGLAEIIAAAVEASDLNVKIEQTAIQTERNRLAREIHDTLAQSLAGIAMRLEAVENDILPQPAAAQATIREVRREVRACLDEARRSVWDLRPAALESSRLVDALRREVAGATEEGLSISLEVDGESSASAGDECEHTLFRIGQEAVNNVRQHSGASVCDISIDFRQNDISLRVADNGHGFDPDSAAGLAIDDGRGFGLASMQERARVAGGRVEIRSNPGIGTEIVAVVPRVASAGGGPALALTSITANVPATAESRIRVLIVDDHEIVRQGIYHMLDNVEGIDIVGEAEDGITAIDQISKLSPDVVLLDLQMPRLDGISTLRRLRELGIDTRVILLTVFAKDEQIFQGLRAGARGYLVKDADPLDIIHAIRTVHDGGSMIPPVVADRLINRLDESVADALTGRELEVLRLLAAGLRNKDIAMELSIGAGTVKWHIKNIYQKLHVTTRTEAARIAQDRGIIDS